MSWFARFCSKVTGFGMYSIHMNESGGSDFMHTESTLLYYKRLIGESEAEKWPCISSSKHGARLKAARRTAFNLQGRKGLLMADAFSANASPGFELTSI